MGSVAGGRGRINLWGGCEPRLKGKTPPPSALQRGRPALGLPVPSLSMTRLCSRLVNRVGAHGLLELL